MKPGDMDDDHQQKTKKIDDARELMREFLNISSPEDRQTLIDLCKRLAARKPRLN